MIVTETSVRVGEIRAFYADPFDCDFFIGEAEILEIHKSEKLSYCETPVTSYLCRVKFVKNGQVQDNRGIVINGHHDSKFS